MVAQSISQQAIVEWLRTHIAKELNRAIDDIDEQESFMDIGLDSLASLEIVGKLESWLDIEMNPSELWDHPNIWLLSKFLMTRVN